MNGSTLRGSFEESWLSTERLVTSSSSQIWRRASGRSPSGSPEQEMSSGPFDRARLLCTFSWKHLPEKHREDPGLSLPCFCPSHQRTDGKSPSGKVLRANSHHKK